MEKYMRIRIQMEKYMRIRIEIYSKIKEVLKTITASSNALEKNFEFETEFNP